MLKLFYCLFLIFITTIATAQLPNYISEGIITFGSGKMLGFNNLSLSKDKDTITFTNISTKNVLSYSLEEIKQIENDSQRIIYKNDSPKQESKFDEIDRTKSITDTQAIIIEETDTSYKSGQPDGIYNTKEDFINKNLIPRPYIKAKGLKGLKKTPLSNVDESCFFYTSNDKKIKNVFAVSYKGHLYFQIKNILKNRNKTDRAQTSSFPQGFVKVKSGGDNYLYAEVDLANLWAQALAYNAGAAGGVLANNLIYKKGVVWDIKNQEFNIFKNCKDFNNFIETIYPKGVQTCEDQQADILLIREVIEVIK